MQEMEIGRDAEEVEQGHSSIQSFQMPWNMSSRQPSRQASVDGLGRPASRNSVYSGEEGFLSSFSHGVLDDSDFRGNSPIQHRHDSRDLPEHFHSQKNAHLSATQDRDLLEKESREFCE